MRLNMDKQQDADNEFKPVFQAVANAVLNGEWALIHCMAGVQRAAAVAVAIRAAIHDEPVASAIQSIAGVRAIRVARILSHFNDNNWNNGDFMQWLKDKAQAARHLWQEALHHRGEIRFGKTQDGIVHLLKRRPHQVQLDDVVPECRHTSGVYNVNPVGQPNPQDVALGQMQRTKTTGKAAVAEAIARPFYSPNLCQECAEHIPAGLRMALHKGHISVQGR